LKMARLIMFSEFTKDGLHKENSINYIATRDGVVANENNTTPNQLALINAMLEGNNKLQIENLDEYQNWKETGTKKEASMLITQMLDFLEVDDSTQNKNMLNYIATRPGSHGLFNSAGTADLNAEKIKLRKFHGNMYNHIFSLKREDAEKLGFVGPEQWQQLLTEKMPKIAEAMKIDLNDLEWNAAYHDNTKYPHIHLQMYSKSNKAYLDKMGIKKIKSIMANEIFSEEMNLLKTEFSNQRDLLHSKFKELFEDKIDSVTNNNLNYEMLKLQKMLENYSGRMVYGYIDAELKKEVSKITYKFLKQNKYLERIFDKYTAAHEAMFFMYNVEKKDYFSYDVINPKKNQSAVMQNLILEATKKIDFDEKIEMYKTKAAEYKNIDTKKINLKFKKALLSIYNNEKDLEHGIIHDLLEKIMKNNYDSEAKEVEDTTKNIIDLICEKNQELNYLHRKNVEKRLFYEYGKDKTGKTYEQFKKENYKRVFYNDFFKNQIKKSAFELSKYKQDFDYEKHYDNLSENLKQFNENQQMNFYFDKKFDVTGYNVKTRNELDFTQYPKKFSDKIPMIKKVRDNVTIFSKAYNLAGKSGAGKIIEGQLSNSFTPEQITFMLNNATNRINNAGMETIKFSNSLRLSGSEQKKFENITGYKITNKIISPKIDVLKGKILEKYWQEIRQNKMIDLLQISDVKNAFLSQKYEKNELVDNKIADVLKVCYENDAVFKSTIDEYVKKRIAIDFQKVGNKKYFRDFYDKEKDKYLRGFFKGELTEKLHNYVFKAANEMRIYQKQFDYEKHAKYVSEYIEKIDWSHVNVGEIVLDKPLEATKKNMDDLLTKFLVGNKLNYLNTKKQEMHLDIKKYKNVEKNLATILKAFTVAKKPIDLMRFLSESDFTNEQKHRLINGAIKRVANAKAETEKFGNELRLNSFETKTLEKLSGIVFFEKNNNYKKMLAINFFSTMLVNAMMELNREERQNSNLQKQKNKKKIKKKLGIKLAGRRKYNVPNPSISS